MNCGFNSKLLSFLESFIQDGGEVLIR